MPIDNDKLLKIKQYIEVNYTPGLKEKVKCKNSTGICASESYGLYEDLPNLKRRVQNNLDDTWQTALFDIIDHKLLDAVEVYKRACLTKQTFSKIRNDPEYHPDKDTAVRLCIGLKLNIDESLDLLSKAGYTLSKSIERDLVVMYFIENKEYDIIAIDTVFEELGFKQFLKY